MATISSINYSEARTSIRKEIDSIQFERDIFTCNSIRFSKFLTMGLNKLIVIIGFAILAIQSTKAASIGTPNCMCTREYFPICGSDDITYQQMHARLRKNQKAN